MEINYFNQKLFWTAQSHCNNSYNILEQVVKLFDRIIRRFVAGIYLFNLY